MCSPIGRRRIRWDERQTRQEPVGFVSVNRARAGSDAGPFYDVGLVGHGEATQHAV